MQENRINECLNCKSKYCYNDTDILINHKDIHNKEVLESVDRLHATFVLSNLYMNPVKGKFDVNHYTEIHKTLFKDLYPFAGRFRKEDISKGTTLFCRADYIAPYLDTLLKEMNKNSYKITSEEELIHFLAYYYSEINIVHPFREGNGRTERKFFREFVLELNNRINFGKYEIDFSKLTENDKKIIILGSIEAASKGTLTYLKQFFVACLTKSNQKQL